MKQSITKYAITDPFVNVFWVRTSYYGCAPDRKLIFNIVFTNQLLDANFMSSEEEAITTLQNMFTMKHVVTNKDLKVDTQSLKVVPITITYEKSS